MLLPVWNVFLRFLVQFSSLITTCQQSTVGARRASPARTTFFDICLKKLLGCGNCKIMPSHRANTTGWDSNGNRQIISSHRANTRFAPTDLESNFEFVGFVGRRQIISPHGATTRKNRWMGLARGLGLGLAFSSLAAAQKTGELPILPTPNGAVLRWYLPNQTFPSAGFRLERTNPDGTKTQVAIASPMPKAEVERQKLLDPKLYDYLQKLYSSPPQTDNEKFQRSIFDLKALSDPKMARVLGVLYTDSGLQTGKKYSYRVLAGSSVVGLSSVVTGKSPTVAVVAKITPSLTPSKITLTWAVPQGGDIVAYRVFKADSSNIFVPVSAEPIFASGTNPSYTDNAITPDRIFQYSISSLDIFGREGARSAVIRVNASLAAPLVAPRIIDIARPDDRLELRFTPVTDKRVTQIWVYRGSNIDKLALLAKLPATASSYKDNAVLGGTSYAYALAVQTGSSLSPRGAAKVATAVNTTPPKMPSQTTIKADTKTVLLTWAKNSEKDLAGYLIYRSNRKTTPLNQADLLTGAPIKAANYTDTLPVGSDLTYVYRIVAINTSGVRSAPSAFVAATLTDKTPPAAPVLVNVTALENSVGLTFQNSDPDAVRLELYRVSPQGRLQLVKKLAPNVTGFIDTTAIANLPYVYTLIAIDAKGNRSSASNRMVGTAVLTLPPAVPVAKIQVKNGVALLTWTRAKPRTYFIIYKQRGTEWIQITEVIDDTKYSLAGVKKGEKYTIRAIDLAGNLSDYSAPLEIL